MTLNDSVGPLESTSLIYDLRIMRASPVRLSTIQLPGTSSASTAATPSTARCSRGTGPRPARTRTTAGASHRQIQGQAAWKDTVLAAYWDTVW